MVLISSSVAPSNTGVANGTPACRFVASSMIPRRTTVLRSSALAAGVVDQRQRFAHVRDLGLRLQQFADALAQTLGRPAQVRFQNLADVHARRHAERIEHDIHRRAVGHVRHVLDRHDLGDDALVAVAAGHLVAGLQPALDRQVDLDHLLHARRQLVAAGQLASSFLRKPRRTTCASVPSPPAVARAAAPLLRWPGGCRTSGSDRSPQDKPW